MKNDKSQSELVKSYATDKNKKEACLKELLIDMIIHESILSYRKSIIKQEINDALDRRDKDRFFQLSEEFLIVERMLGS
ncbi:IDEAL domain-containing protein [Peribacillus sp. SCS-155]|uniref:IDEAL domain-containing protein n=1 Tax=Peribacillus sedimenti TaxID=3115297 RepID=UPI0039057E52